MSTAEHVSRVVIFHPEFFFILWVRKSLKYLCSVMLLANIPMPSTLPRVAFRWICKNAQHAFLSMTEWTHYKHDNGGKTAVKQASDHSDMDIFIRALQIQHSSQVTTHLFILLYNIQYVALKTVTYRPTVIETFFQDQCKLFWIH